MESQASEVPAPVLRRTRHSGFLPHTLAQSDIDDDIFGSLLSGDAVSILVGGGVRRGHGLREWGVWRGDTSTYYTISVRRGGMWSPLATLLSEMNRKITWNFNPQAPWGPGPRSVVYCGTLSTPWPNRPQLQLSLKLLLTVSRDDNLTEAVGLMNRLCYPRRAQDMLLKGAQPIKLHPRV